MNGVLLIDKPRGFTSFDVVAKLRSLLKEKKIGHAGTLDPEVTGVLPVFIGSATKAIPLLPDQDKIYRAEVLLGVTTDTEDLTGKILSEQPVRVTEQEVADALNAFAGDYLQVPPMYSAKKVGGKALYKLARAGQTVERQPVPVKIHEIGLMETLLPEVHFTVRCSKGTYIRTLAADLGTKLGTGAALKRLKRLAHGTFTLEDAYSLTEIETAVKQGNIASYVRPVESLFESEPALTLKAPADRFLRNGNALIPGNFEAFSEPEDGTRFRIRFSDGRFGALYRYSKESGTLLCVKMFLE